MAENRFAQFVAPQPTAQPAEQPTEQPSIVSDIGTGVVAGVQGFGQSVVDLATDVGHVASLGLLGNGESPQLPEVDQPQGVVGQLTKGITQFGLGMLPAAKLAKATGMVAGFGRSMVAGAAADFVAFDEGEARLSNLLAETNNPILNNAVTRYLSADADDSWAEGRFKNVLEGMGLGAAVEVLYRGVRMIKHRPALEGRPGRTAKEGKGLEEAIDGKISAAKLQAAVQHGDTVYTGSNHYEASVRAAEATGKSVDEIIDDAPAQGFADQTGKFYSRAEAAQATGIRGTSPGKGLDTSDLMGDDLLLTPDMVEGIRARTARAVSGEEPWDNVLRDLPLPSDATKFTDEAITGLMNEIGGAVRNASGGPIWDKPQTLNLVRDIAIELGQDPGLVIKQLGELGSKRETAAASIVAGRNMQNELARRFIAASGGAASPEELRPIAEALARTTKAVREAASTGGRTVRAFGVEASSDEAQKLGGALDEFLSTGNLADLQKAAQNVRDPGVIARFFAKLNTGGLIAKVNEYWINALLSGPRTHAINITSNAIMSLTRPLEDALGNLVQGRWAESVDSIAMYGGLVQHLGDSLKMAGRAWMKDGNVLDPVQTVFEHQRGAIKTPGVGTAVRTPTRALATEDEFFKQINYRSRVHVKASREGVARGLRGRDLAEYIEDKVAKSFDPEGAGLDEEALRYAERVTFTNPLGTGTIGQSLQEMVEQHPTLRQVFPFVRTPTNLLRETWFHMPGLGMLGKRYRAQWFASPAARSTMIGRQMVGTAVLGSAFAMAANGNITGAAPKDRALRAAWFAEHPQYSVKIGDNWYPYDRMDPLGMVLGLAADWMTIAAEVTPADADEFGSAMMLAITDRLWGDTMLETTGNVVSTMGMAMMAGARSVENKIYLQSIADILATIESGDKDEWERWGRNRIGSFVPNILRQANQDPYFREVRTAMDAVQSRIPGWSEQVEPRFDPLGRPTMRPGHPIARSIAPTLPIAPGSDPIFAEMNRLGQGFVPVPSKQGEVDLTQFRGRDGKSAYYALNGKIASSDLEGRLKALIESPNYQRLSDNVMAGLEDVLETGSKTAVLRKHITLYRKQAFNRLLQEQGDTLRTKSGLTLMQAYRNDQRNRGLAQIPGQQLLPTQ